LPFDDADEYLDAYHSIDASVEILMRSLRDNPPQTSDDTDDYESEDYYDDYEEDEDTDEADANSDRNIFDDYLPSDHDSSEENEDESILDSDVDREVQSKDVSHEATNNEQGTCSLHTD